MAWFQFWHKQQHLLIDILFFCSILNEQCIQWIQIDSLKTNIKMQWHISSSHLSCATDKAAWQTPQIRMQRFVGWMWIFILYSRNIRNSKKKKNLTAHQQWLLPWNSSTDAVFAQSLSYCWNMKTDLNWSKWGLQFFICCSGFLMTSWMIHHCALGVILAGQQLLGRFSTRADPAYTQNMQAACPQRIFNFSFVFWVWQLWKREWSFILMQSTVTLFT